MRLRTRRLRGGVSAVRFARRAVREELSGELDERRLDDIELLVSELATNCVRHAGCDEYDELLIEAAVDRDCVRVVLCDNGEGFDEQRPPEPPSSGSSGGFGLVLLDRLSDRWGTRQNGGFCVWFEVQRAGHA